MMSVSRETSLRSPSNPHIQRQARMIDGQGGHDPAPAPSARFTLAQVNLAQSTSLQATSLQQMHPPARIRQTTIADQNQGGEGRTPIGPLPECGDRSRKGSRSTDTHDSPMLNFHCMVTSSKS